MPANYQIWLYIDLILHNLKTVHIKTVWTFWFNKSQNPLYPEEPVESFLIQNSDSAL